MREIEPNDAANSFGPSPVQQQVAVEVCDALEHCYRRVTSILHGKPPIFILTLLAAPDGPSIPATLTEREWRFIRFALERAMQSLQGPG